MTRRERWRRRTCARGAAVAAALIVAAAGVPSTWAAEAAGREEVQPIKLTVGAPGTDLPGFTNMQIQCAVDRVAFLGGGVVQLSAGTFAMADSLHLRSHVRVVGQGEETILRKNAQKAAKIIAYLGYGHDDLIVDNPDALALGDGVYLHGDRAADGWNSTVATLVRREGDTWFTSRPHNYDYAKWNNGRVETLFPIVSAREIEDAALEKVVVDGNMDENPTPISDAWGAGVFAFRSKKLLIRGVHVRNARLDGISWQTCDDVEVANCLVETCTGMAYHPGSASNRFHMHDCVARNNGRCGVYYCLRVRDGLIEDCVFENNGEDGVSIGDRDTGHVNRRLVIRNNGGAGIYYRGGDRLDSPHRVTFEQCVLEGNCTKKGDAEIVVAGAVEGTKLIGNVITPRPGKPGILIAAEVPQIEMRDNVIKTDGAARVVDHTPEQIGSQRQEF